MLRGCCNLSDTKLKKYQFMSYEVIKKNCNYSGGAENYPKL